MVQKSCATSSISILIPLLAKLQGEVRVARTVKTNFGR